MMDEETMKLGLLMETAHANQKAVQGSLKKLKAASNELAAIVREEVHLAFLQELQGLAEETRRASDSLRSVGRAANVRVLFWSLSLTLMSSLIPLAFACWLIPTPAQIAALRLKRDDLVASIALLERQGGRIDLRHCGQVARLCVRIDRTAPAYGEQSDYSVVRGY
jgi:hypothetical protein